MGQGKPKIVIIGMGFLATYIIPCYERLIDGDISTDVIGIKASDRGLAERRKQCPFPVEAGNADIYLRERRPDIIILSVKPHQIKETVEKTLIPYYEELRSGKEKLPDLYSFAPSPENSYYYDALGSDVNAANMIPNMVSSLGGCDVSQAGVSFISMDSRRAWPEENRRRALDFMKPTGTVIEIAGEQAIPYLSLQVAGHMMPELCYIVQGAAEGEEAARIAEMFRRELKKRFDEPAASALPYRNEPGKEKLAGFMEMLNGAWHDGELKFALTEGISREAADRMIYGTMATYYMEVQAEPKDVVMQNTANHATPGGFLEKGLRTFDECGRRYISEQLKKWMEDEADKDVYDRCEDIAFTVAKAVSDHGRQM